MKRGRDGRGGEVTKGGERERVRALVQGKGEEKKRERGGRGGSVGTMKVTHKKGGKR